MLLAHCPLCVAGTGLIAAGASFLGIDDLIVGLWIGAFALSLGMVTAKALKRKLFPLQDEIITLVVFLFTVLPSLGFFKHYMPIYLHLFGKYGSLFNKMYIVKRFLIGSFLGALIIIVAPYLNALIVSLRKGKKVPFQKLILTFALLTALSLVFHFYL